MKINKLIFFKNIAHKDPNQEPKRSAYIVPSLQEVD